MKKTILALAVAFCAQGFAAQASATVLGFESLASDDGNFNIGTTYVEQGYKFDDLTSTAYGFASWGSLSEGLFSGSTALINNNDAGLTMLTQVGGGLFQLNSIDLVSMYPGTGTNVTFTGIKADHSSVTQSFLVADDATAVQTFAFASGFTNLSSVSWSNDAMYHQFDNVNVVAVPEPENYAMFLAGLGLLGFVARRRNS